MHDLRRTMRSGLSALKVPAEVAELAIGHTKKGLAAVYDQHEFADKIVEAGESRVYRRLARIRRIRVVLLIPQQEHRVLEFEKLF
jgi:hypothetical protein